MKKVILILKTISKSMSDSGKKSIYWKSGDENLISTGSMSDHFPHDGLPWDATQDRFFQKMLKPGKSKIENIKNKAASAPKITSHKNKNIIMSAVRW